MGEPKDVYENFCPNQYNSRGELYTYKDQRYNWMNEGNTACGFSVLKSTFYTMYSVHEEPHPGKLTELNSIRWYHFTKKIVLHCKS